MSKLPISLSPTDEKLLMALQEDVTQSQVEIAESVGMSRSSCWRRIREFEQAGLIQSKVAILDPQLAGFGLRVLLLVTMNEHNDKNRRSFESYVRKLPEVTECFSVSGDRDYVLQVISKDMDAYSNFLHSRILDQPSVQSASSTFVLKPIKFTTALPLGR